MKEENRISRIFELRCLGYTIPQISDKLQEESFKTGYSERQVWRDLHSDEANRMAEEILRRQLMDIAIADDLKDRMFFRDKILSKIMPRKIESRVESKSEVQLTVKRGEEIEELLEEYRELFDDTEDAMESTEEDCAGEPMDTAQANG
jgi:hypothetical protein